MGKRAFFVAGAFSLVVLGVLCATTIERVRASNRRADLVARYDEMLRERNAGWMEMEKAVVGSIVTTEVRLVTNLRTVDDALDHGHVDIAARAWQDAYGAALGSRQWESMAEVADAALRIAATPTAAATGRAQARQSYMIALYRARAAGSVDGVLRMANAFDGLGDRAAALSCVQIAADVALQNGNERDRARVRTVMEQMTAVTRRP